MSSSDSFISDIPTYFMVLFAVGMITMLFIGGLLDLDTSVSVDQKVDYRTAVMMENLLSLDASIADLESVDSVDEGYEYEERRAVIPIEYFTNSPPSDEGIGYKKSGEHCYIPKVPGLDGENYGFRIIPVVDEEKYASDPIKKLPDECKGMEFSEDEKNNMYLRRSVISPALLVRKDNGNPSVQARLFVYYIRPTDELAGLMAP